MYDTNARSGVDPAFLRCAHQLLAEGRDYHLSWPLFLYLDENPDHLPGLGEGTTVKLWQGSPTLTGSAARAAFIPASQRRPAATNRDGRLRQEVFIGQTLSGTGVTH